MRQLDRHRISRIGTHPLLFQGPILSISKSPHEKWEIDIYTLFSDTGPEHKRVLRTYSLNEFVPDNSSYLTTLFDDDGSPFFVFDVSDVPAKEL